MYVRCHLVIQGLYPSKWLMCFPLQIKHACTNGIFFGPYVPRATIGMLYHKHLKRKTCSYFLEWPDSKD